MLRAGAQWSMICKFTVEPENLCDNGIPKAPCLESAENNLILKDDSMSQNFPKLGEKSRVSTKKRDYSIVDSWPSLRRAVRADKTAKRNSAKQKKKNNNRDEERTKNLRGNNAGSSSCDEASPSSPKTPPFCKETLESETTSNSLDERSPALDCDEYIDINNGETSSSEETTPSCETTEPSCAETTPFCEEPLPRKSSCIYVVKKNAKKSYCRICGDGKMLIPTIKIEEHINGKLHAQSLRRYDCKSIGINQKGRYYCFRCKVKMRHLESVYLHIQDKRHTGSTIKTAVVQSACDHSALPAPEKYCINDILRAQVENIFSACYKSTNRLIDGGIANVEQRKTIPLVKSARFKKKADVKGFKKMRKTNEASVELHLCRICKSRQDNLEILHPHMAKHFIEEFLSPRITVENGTSDAVSDDEEDHSSRDVPTSAGSPEDLEDSSGPKVVEREKKNPSEGINGEGRARGSPDGFSPDGIVDEETDESEDESDSQNSTTPDFAPNKKKVGVRKFNMPGTMEELNFPNTKIYDMSENQKNLERSFKFFVTVDSESIYCLVCLEIFDNNTHSCYAHSFSADHCRRFETMEQDHDLFIDFPDEFSELDLAREYMRETSDYTVRCFACRKNLENEKKCLDDHISEDEHQRIRGEMRKKASAIHEEMKLCYNCDWYNVTRYVCALCGVQTNSEGVFSRHLRNVEHARNVKKPYNGSRSMMFHFCPWCARLWYGKKSSYAAHSRSIFHELAIGEGRYVLGNLSKLTRDFIARHESYADNMLDYLDRIAETEQKKVDVLIRRLENIARTKFPRAKAHSFGSRVSGLGFENSDIDVYLECRPSEDGEQFSEHQTFYFITSVHKSLVKYPQFWDVEEPVTNCRSPIIRSVHRETGLACDISFDNCLSVENTKLIRAYVRVYPLCRKLILIMKQWLVHCGLTGQNRISSYSMYWLVIFYLQQESILPSVATLISMKNKSKIVAGWEVGVTHIFSHWEQPDISTITDLLKGFWTFYANFDFRNDVVCPLLGKTIEKRDFGDPSKLPPEMQPYVNYMKKSSKSQPFRIDSPMCVQDPFDLQHNTTKAVSKVYVNRFSKFCAWSFDSIESP